MARTAVLGRLNWKLGEVVELIDETPRVRSIVLDVPEWPGHRAGQHVDVRLTAEDGYQAQRSYSIASAPEDDRLMLTVERLSDGEVSPYLVDELRPGDSLELRGPIGGYFVWEAGRGGPRPDRRRVRGRPPHGDAPAPVGVELQGTRQTHLFLSLVGGHHLR
jgi:Oxidoreductase FAD-binding domain